MTWIMSLFFWKMAEIFKMKQQAKVISVFSGLSRHFCPARNHPAFTAVRLFSEILHPLGALLYKVQKPYNLETMSEFSLRGLLTLASAIWTSQTSHKEKQILETNSDLPAIIHMSHHNNA